MPTEQQRTELHRTIWSMADELRGAVGGWEFKAYVLGTLFYRFISENITEYVNNLQQEAGISDFNYADMSDEVLQSPQRIANNVSYILEHFSQKTKQQERYAYRVISNVVDVAKDSCTAEEKAKRHLGDSTVYSVWTLYLAPSNTTRNSKNSRLKNQKQKG